MENLLNYKLGILKLEIETINGAILNKDNASRQLKTWAITLWTATTTLTGLEHFTGNPKMIDLLAFSIPITTLWAIFTLAVPMTFLILEIYHRRIQRKFIWRARKIHAFLNDRSLCKAFEENDIEDFPIYDPAGENWRCKIGGSESKEFEQFVSFWTVLRIQNVFVLYLALALLSGVLALVPLWV